MVRVRGEDARSMHRATIAAFLFVLASHATHIAGPSNEFIQLSIGLSCTYNDDVETLFLMT